MDFQSVQKDQWRAATTPEETIGLSNVGSEIMYSGRDRQLPEEVRHGDITSIIADAAVA